MWYSTFMHPLLTAPLDKPVTLFLVGMQCRSWRSLWKVPLIGRRMGQMQQELQSDPESGLLWGANFIQFNPLTALYLSYWKSTGHIHRFVEDGRFAHKAASPEYLKRFGSDPDIGVWHETYEIEPGKAENLYMGMAPFGVSAFMPTSKLTSANRKFMDRFRRT